MNVSRSVSCRWLITIPERSTTATSCFLSFVPAMINPTIIMVAAKISGTSIVVTMKDFFLTRVRYSLAMTVFIILKFMTMPPRLQVL